jgi:hypothetical protein
MIPGNRSRSAAALAGGIPANRTVTSAKPAVNTVIGLFNVRYRFLPAPCSLNAETARSIRCREFSIQH